MSGSATSRFHVEKQLSHCVRPGGVEGENRGGSRLRERFQLIDISGGETYLHADPGQAPRKRSADARSGSNDQGTAIGEVGH